ncbi:hypothetical protein KAR91_38360, partial [Candidatus Pacearchaeota archaeon]|nr:hypothetical protein [Candidatus Pacearchaeota archaeon]
MPDSLGIRLKDRSPDATAKVPAYATYWDSATDLIENAIEELASHGFFEGLLSSPEFSRTNMVVSNEVFQCVTGDGIYCKLASGNVTHDAADDTNPRIDIICVNPTVRTSGGEIVATGVVEIIKGTAAAKPLVPNTPSNKLKVAEVDIPASASEVTLRSWSPVYVKEVMLRPKAQETEDMTVQVNFFRGYVSGNTLVETDVQDSGAFSEPAANKCRLDILRIDSSGSLGITEGAEVDLPNEPSAPTYPTGEIVICEVYLEAGDTAIYQWQIKDVRPTLNLGGTDWSAGATVVSMIDNNAAAVDFMEAANSYLKFVTTNGSEKIVVGVKLELESLLYINRPSETEAVNGAWITLTSTVTSGDLTGIRSRVFGNAASAGANVRGGYLEAKMGAGSKYAAMLEGGLFHADYSAGSATISGDVRGFTAQISQGSGLDAANLYGGLINIQTRGDETIATDDVGLMIRNEAVGGNGRTMDSGIKITDLNMGGGTSGFTYGIDLNGVGIATADIRFSGGQVITSTAGALTLPAFVTTEIKLEGGAHDTTIVPGTPSEAVTYILPAADGANGEVLATDGSGTLTWAAAGGASTYLQLTDTPAAYDNGKYAKSTAAGVVWDTPAGAGDMLKATYDTGPSGVVDAAEDLDITNQAAGDVLYCDGGNWVRLAKDEGKYLKSGAAAVAWDEATVGYTFAIPIDTPESTGADKGVFHFAPGVAGTIEEVYLI